MPICAPDLSAPDISAAHNDCHFNAQLVNFFLISWMISLITGGLIPNPASPAKSFSTQFLRLHADISV